MRKAAFLFPLLLVGCSISRAPETELAPAGLALASGQRVDAAPELKMCDAPTLDSSINVPMMNVRVRFEVAPDGSVVPGSAQVVGEFGIRNGSERDPEVIRARFPDRSAAREWAQKRVEACTFAPAQRDGEAVAAKVQHDFNFAV